MDIRSSAILCLNCEMEEFELKIAISEYLVNKSLPKIREYLQLYGKNQDIDIQFSLSKDGSIITKAAIVMKEDILHPVDFTLSQQTEMKFQKTIKRQKPFNFDPNKENETNADT